MKRPIQRSRRCSAREAAPPLAGYRGASTTSPDTMCEVEGHATTRSRNARALETSTERCIETPRAIGAFHFREGCSGKTTHAVDQRQSISIQQVTPHTRGVVESLQKAGTRYAFFGLGIDVRVPAGTS